MSGTTSTLPAVRNGSAPAQGTPNAALDLRAGQSMWTRDQHAALVAMGIPKEATSAELGVFLHQCQRTGLDPFSRQIYLIYRQSYENGKYVNKPTTQVGIDGFRVIRDRIAKREGLRVEYEETVWYDGAGEPCDVWLWDEPPAACKVVVVVDGRRFPSVLRFGEYAQRKKDGALNKMWAEKSAHMIEKCAEADALRKAFPNDMAGVMLEDSAPLPEDAPPAPRRVTAEQARDRRPPQTVTAEVVGTPSRPAAPAGAEARGDAARDAMDEIAAEMRRLGIDQAAQLGTAAAIAGRPLKTAADLTAAEARKVADTLAAMSPGDLEEPDQAALDQAAARDETADGE